MNKKKLLILSVILGALVIGVVIYFLTAGSDDAKKTALRSENWDAPFPVSPELAEQVMTMFDDEEMPSIEVFMNGLATGKINLIWELWSMREKCPKDMDRYQCNSR